MTAKPDHRDECEWRPFDATRNLRSPVIVIVNVTIVRRERMLAARLEHGRAEELHAMIEKRGRQIDNLIKPGRLERH